MVIASLFLGGFAYSQNIEKQHSNNVAIFYPQAKDPYKSIYQNIMNGSHDASTKNNQVINIKQYRLKKTFDIDEIAQNLKKNNIDKVIVLGRLGLKLAKQLSKYTTTNNIEKFQIISGALPINPNGVSGISLIADPAHLFEYLKQVAPNVKKIHVAYSKKSAWLIDLAKSAAKEKGLKLNLQQVSSTAQAVTFYKNIFSSGIANKDAIWLPFDRISSHDKITLPYILEKAWTKEVVVFSSKPSHAKRGALFSTYPDNFALGAQLLQMVQGLKQQPKQKNFAALKSTLLAVNLRTAAHLGLKYSPKQQQLFKLTFPQ